MRWGLVVVALLGGAVACGNDRPVEPGQISMRAAPEPADRAEAKVGMGVAAGPAAAMETAPTPAGQFKPAPTDMIIRTGNVAIEVDSVELAVQKVTDLATRAGGYVANATVQTGENETRSATLELKVPAERYDGTIDGLKAVGEIKNASTNTQDVGEEFVDVTARVTNSRKLEDRLLNLLATRTGKLEDVLTVERELARVREEIERYEGRLRYLRTKVSMSSIVVNVYEPGPIVGAPGQSPIVDALRQSWRNFVSVVAGGIAVSGGLLPVIAVALIVVWVGRRWWRRQQVPPVG